MAARHASDGILACTNHFRTEELAVIKWCPRYQKLIQARKADQPLNVADVAKKMDEVNMGRLTVQTMVFRAGRTPQVAFGDRLVPIVEAADEDAGTQAAVSAVRSKPLVESRANSWHAISKRD